MQLTDRAGTAVSGTVIARFPLSISVALHWIHHWTQLQNGIEPWQGIITIQSSRRLFLKRGTLAGGAVLALGNSGICLARWPGDVFENSPTDAAIDALLEGAEALRSEKIQLATPDQHQNPALVPVAVSSSLPAISSVSLFADNTDAPLLASFEFGRHPVRHLSTRIRVRQSTQVWAIVKSEESYYISGDSVKIVPFRS